MLDVASRHDDVVVVAAADLSIAAIDAGRSRHPRTDFSRSPTELVSSDDIGALYIATPPDTHAALVIPALESGKSVLCEKPLAIGLADGRRMLSAAETGGLVAAVNFALSDRHAFLHVERAHRAGALGVVRGVDVRLSFPEWPRDFQVHAAWLAGRRQGGFVREVFSHFAYATDRLLGPLKVVEASVDYPDDRPDGAEWAARALLRAGDVPVHVSGFAGLTGPEMYEWTVWGTKQSYMLRDWGELSVWADGNWTAVELSGERGSEATRLSSFAAAVKGMPARNLADFAAALRVQQVVEAFHSTLSQ